MLEGLPLIVELMKRAGDRIVIMPGGGITERNVERIVAQRVRAKSTSPRSSRPPSAMRFRREHVFMGGELRPPEYERLDVLGAG